jgi:chromosome segregation ATPase
MSKFDKKFEELMEAVDRTKSKYGTRVEGRDPKTMKEVELDIRSLEERISQAKKAAGDAEVAKDEKKHNEAMTRVARLEKKLKDLKNAVEKGWIPTGIKK